MQKAARIISLDLQELRGENPATHQDDYSSCYLERIALLGACSLGHGHLIVLRPEQAFLGDRLSAFSRWAFPLEKSAG